MKKPVVDYTKLRFSNINSPEYKHLWLLLGWVWYLTMYVLTERLIAPEKCHLVHSTVDDLIPFNEYFVLFYTSWYFLIVASLLYFLLYDPKSFVNLQKFIIATQVIAVIIYLIWPSVQDLRPAEFARENFCTWILGIIYGVDTPTGVCPSLHVGYSLAILSAWLKKRDAKLWWKALLVPWTAMICISVCFVKQHSFTDVWTAVLMCILIEIVLFGSYHRERIFGRGRKPLADRTAMEELKGKEGTA